MRDLTAQFTAQATMDHETLREYDKAVPDPQTLANDHLGKPVQFPFHSDPKPAKPVAGMNIQKPTPLKSPPGIHLCDRIADHFAALDRRELKQRLGVKDEPPKDAA